MDQALLLAQQAAEAGEIPVGALVVCRQRIIGKGSNPVSYTHLSSA